MRQPRSAMERLFRLLTNALASGLYVSYLPVSFFRNGAYSGAGLVGTLWGLATLRVLPQNAVRQIIVLAGVFCIAVAVCDWAEQFFGRRDDPRIVLDEFLGYWLAASFLPRTFAVMIMAFVLFRILDVQKPLGIRNMGEFPGGWGVVLDDVLAGFYANALLRAAEWIHPF